MELLVPLSVEDIAKALVTIAILLALAWLVVVLWRPTRRLFSLPGGKSGLLVGLVAGVVLALVVTQLDFVLFMLLGAGPTVDFIRFAAAFAFVSIITFAGLRLASARRSAMLRAAVVGIPVSAVVVTSPAFAMSGGPAGGGALMLVDLLVASVGWALIWLAAFAQAVLTPPSVEPIEHAHQADAPQPQDSR